MPASPETVVQAHIPQSPEPYVHHKHRPKSGVRLNKLMLSTYFRIALTFLLLIILFLTASFIAFQSEQKRKRLKEYEKPIPEAEIIVPETNEFSNITWETYTNKEYGYTLSYPSHWEVVEAKPNLDANQVRTVEILRDNDLHRVTFLEQEVVLWQGSFDISVHENPLSFDTREWADDYSQRDNLASPSGEIEIDSHKAKKFTVFTYDSYATTIGLVKNGFIYTFGFTDTTPNDPELEKHSAIYNQILSTFKFTE